MRKTFILLLTIVSLIVVGYYIYQEHRFQNFKIHNHTFLIEKQDDIHRKNETLQTLVNLRQNLNKLVKHLLKKYPTDPKVKRLHKRFEETVLKEKKPDPPTKKGTPQTSYTINKGDTMVLCLRTRDGRLVNFNTLTYVAIHELAHIYSSTLHHSPEFWKNMKFLINEGIHAKIYKRVNYSKNPVKYCGIQISSNIPAKH